MTLNSMNFRGVYDWDNIPLLMDSVLVARLFGCSEQKVRRMANENKIPAYRIGNEVRFKKEEIREYINSCKM